MVSSFCGVWALYLIKQRLPRNALVGPLALGISLELRAETASIPGDPICTVQVE